MFDKKTLLTHDAKAVVYENKSMTDRQFQEFLWAKGRALYRDMPWRQDTRGYAVLVSELMLQQTQVARVIPKFERFIEVFPDEQALAHATLSEVLALWQGLGYNRRAKFLWEAAKMIVDEFDGHVPSTEAELVRLPGVGKNTAGAIRVYTFNQPSIFVETNVRTVYMHHFFAERDVVSDVEIIEKLTATLDHEHPREFYWAIMDYGAALKHAGVRTNARVKGYKKQSQLEGSVRQMRGRIIAVLTERGALPDAELRRAVQADKRYASALAGLRKDGLIVEIDQVISLG